MSEQSFREMEAIKTRGKCLLKGEENMKGMVVEKKQLSDQIWK